MKIRLLLKPGLLIVTIGFAIQTLALPQGGSVASGDVNITQPSSTQQVIKQTSNSGIINWQSFSIGTREHVHFDQPSITSTTLNRVIGENPSYILGRLTSVGKIFLINRSGIVFGQNARVDVGSLLASTADITDQDFLSGNYHFTQPAGFNTSIINLGHIQAAQGGFVALLAPGVKNVGVIQATLGKVVLGSGTEYTVDMDGDGLIHFSVQKDVLEVPKDQNGQPMRALIDNHGEISAPGGHVLLSARGAHEIIDNVINTSGIIEANSVQQHRGEIVLAGGEHGNVNITGEVNALGDNQGELGGSIIINGERIIIGADGIATLDASGAAGGGEILIGQGSFGSNNSPMAEVTTLEPDGRILANAISDNPDGHGGQVILWSTANTFIGGSIEAKHGGQIETSSLGSVTYGNNARVNAGRGGHWLTDPATLTIDAALASTIVAALEAGTNYTAQAANLITVNSAIDTYASPAGTTFTLNSGLLEPGFGVINIGAAIQGSFDLYLAAAGTITPNAPINVRDFVLQSGNWYQVAPLAPLPTFSTTRDFQLLSGSQFTRGILLGGGNIGVEDIYGLQGMQTNLSGTYTLMNDIDAGSTTNWYSGAGFLPAGSSLTAAFTGTLNGGGYVISDLFINRPSTNEVGLIGWANGATINNLGLQNVNITGGNKTAGLVADMSAAGIISNVYVTGSVTGDSAGGIAGSFSGSLSNSYNAANVQSLTGAAGGIAFDISGVGTTLTDVYNTGIITGQGTSGGIAGNQDGNATISNAWSSGRVTSVSSTAGGIIGTRNASITNAYWDTETSGMATGVGTGSAVGLTGLTTAQAMQQANYSGFTFPGTWNIIAGSSYPYLVAFYPTTPQVISGNATIAGAGNSVDLFVNGSVYDSAITGYTNQFYYFLVPNSTFSAGTPLLLVINGAQKSNNLQLATVGGATGISNFSNNLVFLGSGVTPTNMGTAKGSLGSAEGVLYTISGNNINLNTNVSLQTNSAYNLLGNITASGGNLQFNNNVSLAEGVTSELTTGGGNVNFGGTVNGTAGGSTENLSINSGAGDITFSGNVGSTTPLGAITIGNARNVTIGNMFATSFTQTAGIGTTGFSNLSLTGNSAITTNIVNGTLTVNALDLGAAISANLFGSIGGASGQTGADNIILLNTIEKGTHFFDSIDLYKPTAQENVQPQYVLPEYEQQEFLDQTIENQMDSYLEESNLSIESINGDTDKVLSEAIGNPEFDMHYGEQQLRFGKVQNAFLTFNRITIDDPESLDSRLLLIISYLHLGMYNQAMTELKFIKRHVKEPKILDQINLVEKKLRILFK